MVPAMTFSTPRNFFYAGGAFDLSWIPWIWNNIAPDVRARKGLEGPRTGKEAAAAWVKLQSILPWRSAALRPAGAAPRGALLLRVARASAGRELLGLGGAARPLREGQGRGAQPVGLARRGLRPRRRDHEFSGARRREAGREGCADAAADRPLGARGRGLRPLRRPRLRSDRSDRLRGNGPALSGPVRSGAAQRRGPGSDRPDVRHGRERMADRPRVSPSRHPSGFALPLRGRESVRVRADGRQGARAPSSPIPPTRSSTRLRASRAPTTTGRWRSGRMSSFSRRSRFPRIFASSGRSASRCTCRATRRTSTSG